MNTIFGFYFYAQKFTLLRLKEIDFESIPLFLTAFTMNQRVLIGRRKEVNDESFSYDQVRNN